ncbi:MAG: cytochrome o ubiquinol oxidase subunit IV [Gammaproteobacteria bacterium RIFCSPHIGHO2_12_FULL_45_12]|nr:MAG: cytochrome o ubiquinol oxidase subunit IV [Gammaproteobacteria bacterium RIFCSPHIGHO2_12_FULL_45_12]
MAHHDVCEPDFGVGHKKLGIYTVGMIACSLLTVAAFWAVMSQQFDKGQTFVIIYMAACVQFVVQVLCFLRLNTQTEQARTNVMSLVFIGVILTAIVAGSLWIMSNLHYHMMMP